MGIERHQRVERPQHLAHAHLEDLFALVLLQPAPDTPAAQLLWHRQHVRPVHQAPVAHSGEPVDESHQLVTDSEGARRHPAQLLGDAQHRRRHQLRSFLSPGISLQLQAGRNLPVLPQRTDLDRYGVAGRHRPVFRHGER